MLRSALSRYPQYGLCWHAAGRARGRAGLITGAEYRPAVSRSLSTTSLGEEAHPQAGNRTDSSGADSLDTPKKLVRWARFGKMLKPDDVAKLLSDAQMPIDSGDSAQEDDDAEEDAIDALPSVRVRAKPRNPLHGLPDSEICYTVRALPCVRDLPPIHGTRTTHPRAAPAPFSPPERCAVEPVCLRDRLNPPALSHRRHREATAQAQAGDQTFAPDEPHAIPVETATTLRCSAVRCLNSERLRRPRCRHGHYRPYR